MTENMKWLIGKEEASSYLLACLRCDELQAGKGGADLCKVDLEHEISSGSNSIGFRWRCSMAAAAAVSELVLSLTIVPGLRAAVEA